MVAPPSTCACHSPYHATWLFPRKSSAPPYVSNRSLSPVSAAPDRARSEMSCPSMPCTATRASALAWTFLMPAEESATAAAHGARRSGMYAAGRRVDVDLRVGVVEGDGVVPNPSGQFHFHDAVEHAGVAQLLRGVGVNDVGVEIAVGLAPKPLHDSEGFAVLAHLVGGRAGVDECVVERPQRRHLILQPVAGEGVGESVERGLGLGYRPVLDRPVEFEVDVLDERRTESIRGRRP